MLASFTAPSLSDGRDVFMIAFLVVFCLIAGLGNKLNIPFLTRDGGTHPLLELGLEICSRMKPL